MLPALVIRVTLVDGSTLNDVFLKQTNKYLQVSSGTEWTSRNVP